MARKSSTAASGKIHLYSENWESSGGHAEENSSAFIMAKDRNVVLELDRQSYNFYKSQNETESESYKISINDLIDFMKNKGEKI